MRSDEAGTALIVPPAQATVRRLLDPAFGFFVWLGHFVVIYVANAVACGLQLTSAHPNGSALLVIALAALTIAAAGAVAWHGARRYRALNAPGEPDFLLRVAVGNDAIAVFAILWQLIPIFMSPVCQ